MAERDRSVKETLRRLEESLAELRAETGTEALELRARVRALEKRLDELATAAPEAQARPKRKKAERPKQRTARSAPATRRRTQSS